MPPRQVPSDLTEQEKGSSLGFSWCLGMGVEWEGAGRISVCGLNFCRSQNGQCQAFSSVCSHVGQKEKKEGRDFKAVSRQTSENEARFLYNVTLYKHMAQIWLYLPTYTCCLLDHTFP